MNLFLILFWACLNPSSFTDAVFFVDLWLGCRRCQTHGVDFRRLSIRRESNAEIRASVHEAWTWQWEFEGGLAVDHNKCRWNALFSKRRWMKADDVVFCYVILDWKMRMRRRFAEGIMGFAGVCWVKPSQQETVNPSFKKTRFVNLFGSFADRFQIRSNFSCRCEASQTAEIFARLQGVNCCKRHVHIAISFPRLAHRNSVGAICRQWECQS